MTSRQPTDPTDCIICVAPRNSDACICPLLDECGICSTPLGTSYEADAGTCAACFELYGCHECGNLVRDGSGELVEHGERCRDCDERMSPQRAGNVGIRVASRARMGVAL